LQHIIKKQLASTLDPDLTMMQQEKELGMNLESQLIQVKKIILEGSPIQAATLCEKIFLQFPENTDILFMLGCVRHAEGRLIEAAQLLEKAHLACPENMPTKKELINVYIDNEQFIAATSMARKFLRHPFKGSYSLAFMAFSCACDWAMAKQIRKKVIEDITANAQETQIDGDLLLALHNLEHTYFSNSLKDRQFSALSNPSHPLCKFTANPPKSRLKIAYLSTDFNSHPIGYIIYPIIQAHNRKDMEIYCYAHCYGTIDKYDRTTDKIRSVADHFIDITAMSDSALAKRIHADGIDVLIDLTANSRMATLALRPSPVQISWLAHPYAGKCPEIDFYITDHHVTDCNATPPPKDSLYMPESFLCFDIPTDDQMKSIMQREKDAPITFATFSHQKKINPGTIKIWCEILNRVPGSRMALKKRWNSQVIWNHILSEFVQHGITSERLIILPVEKTYHEYLDQYHMVDIVLDTFPYTGAATTCEALLMGVPVVSLVGKHPAHRISYSILKNIGHTETIAYDLESYIHKAVKLAKNEAILNDLKNKLPFLFKQSILGHANLFTAQLEATYHQAWKMKSALVPATMGKKEIPKPPSRATSPAGALPGRKEIRHILLCDQLNPLTWHVLRTHCDPVAKGSSQAWLVIIVPDTFQQQRIISNICGYLHFNYTELLAPVNTHIISTGKTYDFEATLTQCSSVYRIKYSQHSASEVTQLSLEQAARKKHCNIIPICAEILDKDRTFLHPMAPLQSFKVTVCIPTYNRCDLLKHAVTSVLNQSYENLELLITDDASSDGTEAYCRKLAEHDSRIRYHRNPENIGNENNHMQTYDMIETDLFVICSDDDFLEPDHLLRTTGLMRQKPELGFVYGQCNIVNMQGEVRNSVNFTHSVDCLINPRQELLESFLRCQIVWSTAIYRKTAVNSMLESTQSSLGLSFRDIYKQGGDYLLGILMLAHTPAGYVDTPTFNFRINPASYSSTLLDFGLEIDITVLDYLYQLYKRIFGFDSEAKRALKVGLLRRLKRLQATSLGSESIHDNEQISRLKQTRDLSQKILALLEKTESDHPIHREHPSDTYFDTVNLNRQ